MKKVILIFSLLLFVVCPVKASELTGLISTNPNELPGEEPNDPVLPDDPGTGGGQSSGGSTIILPNPQKQIITDKEDISDNRQDEEIIVLGISHGVYQDGALLRARDKKIYIIEGQVKKHIASLSELKKYTGQIIYDVSSEVLVSYQSRLHLNNDLIREQGREEIYIIENGRKRHIVSLEELRIHYFGQEIFNISANEMRLYLI